MNYHDINGYAKERINDMIDRSATERRWQNFAHAAPANPLERLSDWWDTMTRRKPQRQLKRSR